MKEYLQKRLYDLIDKINTLITEVDADINHKFHADKINYGLKKIEEGIETVNNGIELIESY